MKKPTNTQKPAAQPAKVEAPVTTAPASTAPVAAPVEAKPVKARYAPRGAVQANMVITVLVDRNPKQTGSDSATRFEMHENGITVAALQQKYVKAGLKAGKAVEDLRWDIKHGFVKVEAPEPKPETK